MNRILSRSLGLCLAVVVAMCGDSLLADDATGEPKTTYTDHVRPILREYCFSCHNQNKAQNDLKVDSYDLNP